MIEVQTTIFSRLYDALEGTRFAVQATDRAARRFVFGGPPDQDALMNAEIDEVESLLDIGALASLSWTGAAYFALPAAVLIDYDEDEEVQAEASNTGLRALMLANENVHLDEAEPERIFDTIMGREGRFEIDEIEPFFRNFRMYRLSPNVEARTSPERWSRCQALCAKGLARRSRFPWILNNRSTLLDACSGSAGGVVGANLLNSVRSGHWRHAYLELYRGIEWLFRVHCVEQLVDRLPSIAAESRVAISEAVDEALQWRMREDTVLTRLVAQLGDASRGRIANALGVAEQAEKIATKLYRARNAIAHGSPVRDRLEPERDRLVAGALMTLADIHSVVTTPGTWLM
jgi:hypothetical protein